MFLRLFFKVAIVCILTMVSTISSQAILFAGSCSIVDMQVESLRQPLSIDTETPHFSWKLRTNIAHARGVSQSAYRIEVYDETGLLMWDTGKRRSSVSINIPYAGNSLLPQKHYVWKLSVWDHQNKRQQQSSWFETGLMCSRYGESAWDGAEWIGGDDNSRPLYAPYLNVFRLSYSICLDSLSSSRRAGFIYGSHEERLMDANKNLFHLSSSGDRHYCEIELDIAPLDKGEPAVLNFYRVGYHPADLSDKPMRSFQLPTQLIHCANRYRPHSISFSSSVGTTKIQFDGVDLGALFVNPMGNSGDFISFPSLCHVGYHLHPGQIATFSNLKIRHFRSPSNLIASCSEPVRLEGGKLGLLQTFDPSRNTMPLLRSEFSVSSKAVKRARLYATSRGIYDYYINGQPVSQDYFNPGLTQYNRTHLYQTFDVTPLIRSGNNACGVVLAEGWWSGAITYTPENTNMFGDRQSFLSKLVITYADGTTQTIVSSPQTWKYSSQGPVVYASFFHGQVYDAQREETMRGWVLPGFNDSGWLPARQIPLEGNVATEGLQSDYSHLQFLSQDYPTVRAVDTLHAVSVDEVRPGLYIYDMGQNMAAVPLIRFKNLKPGSTVRMRFAEMKYPDLPAYSGNIGMIMLENIRSARAQDVYIARGGDETFSPRFTFHGYRYMEVSGVDTPPQLEDIAAIPLSSIRPTASFETSNEKVNRLWQNINWSACSNFLSIPTDCPQRNERMGWCGDISVFSRTATYLTDVSGFLRSYLRGMRDIQSPDGRFPDVAPVGGGFGGLLWGSAGITVPWECFCQYADTVLLAEHYPAVQRYIEYIRSNYIDKNTGVIVQTHSSGDLGDWLSLEYEKSDKSLFWECYYIYDLDLVSKMATVLGKTDDADYYAQLAQERREFFKRTYLQQGTLKTICSSLVPERLGQLVDVQTSYVLPLAFHVVDDSDAQVLMKHLEETITRRSVVDGGKELQPYSLLTGFIGTAWINRVLSDMGRSDLAYRLLLQTSYPSWLYSVEQGATTIWERVNSYTIENGFGGLNSMNSFNHYSFGAVGSWMINHVLGIRSLESSPGFQYFELYPQPDPTGGLTYARGHYDSRYGRISSSWQVNHDRIVYDFTLPANTTASLCLQATSPNQVTESGRRLHKKGKGYRLLSSDGRQIRLELQSGSYHFEVAR